MKDILGYEGKEVVVVGAATGMGDAAARTLVELGAEVHALDVAEITAPVKQTIEIDLRDKASIDAAIEKLPARVDSLFHCAGLPGAPFSNLDTMLVNFVGQRHFTEAMVPRIADGGAGAGDEVDDSGGESGLDEELHDAPVREHRSGGGLP